MERLSEASDGIIGIRVKNVNKVWITLSTPPASTFTLVRNNGNKVLYSPISWQLMYIIPFVKVVQVLSDPLPGLAYRLVCKSVDFFLLEAAL